MESMALRDGESLADFKARHPMKRETESWAEYEERVGRQDSSVLRMDARGGDDEDGDGLDADAGAERDKMIARRMNASGVTRTPDPEVPDAAQARKDMVKRKVDASKRGRGESRTDPPAKPPKSASFAKAEEEGEEQEGDDEEEGEDEFDAAKAKAASDARKTGGKR